ncbi:hypothetical protein KC345_g8686 [Hortaea werneckii]|nr:hypothetical protein KC345_g8686 [Hortaea werneckii]
MDETLVYLGRIRNDQDPVRGAVFKELSESPASVYTDAHVQELTLLVDSVIDARDTSYGTKFSVQQLAFAILRHNAGQPHGELFKFALNTIQKLAKQNGQLSLPSIEKNLPQGVEEIIFNGIYTFAAQATRREDYNLVLSLANSFGKRGYGILKLQTLLKEATRAKADYTAAQAARYWLASRKMRDERVKELLAFDKSYITIHEVFQHLHLKRQEWLDPYISGAVIKGRFLTGKTIYPVPAADGFHRWLPRQQQALSSLLERIASDSKRNLWERSSVIRVMARMPNLGPEKVRELVQDKEVAVAEAALHALSLLEEPEKALPILLDNLDGDRARVAMYSIPRCIRRVNPVLLASMLKELLHRDKLKITVRKEAIRLLGAYRSDDSIPLLMNEFGKSNAHKDVVIAIGHAARQLLDDERGWDILSAMAASPQSDIAQSILSQQPGELPADHRPRYLQLIIGIASHADATVGRQAFHSMIRWTNGNEAAIAEATAKAIVDLEDSTRWNAAMNTLIETCRDGKVNGVVIGVCQKLAGRTVSDEWNAAPARDLPHRQRLNQFVNQLSSLPKNTRIHLIPLYLELIDCHASDETLQQAVMKLYIAAIDWNNTEEAAAYLKRIVHGTANQPQLLSDAYKQAAHNLKDSTGYWDPETLLQIVDLLGTEDSDGIGGCTMKILITGFEPFGGEPINPSLEAVKRLDNRIAGAELIKRSLPVVFQKAVEQLTGYIEEDRPDVVICIGQAGGVSGITVERIAVNLMDASIADNKGYQPEDVPVIAGGPNAYFSSLPVKKIVERIKDNGLPAVLSNSAGTYVCNNTMYGLLHHIEQHCPDVRGGFIHVPYIPEQVLDKPGKASMAPGDIVRAIGYAIEAVVEARA